jgi:recombination protein RecA
MAKKLLKKSSECLDVLELKQVTHYLSTGCTILDLAIADKLPGGFGGGRISHIWGPESTGKSIISLEPLGSAQRQGGNATFIDAEGTLDLERAQGLFGVDTENLNYISPITNSDLQEITIEYLFDDPIEKALKKAKAEAPSVLSVDSISAVSSDMEMDEKDPYGSSRAKALSAEFRKKIWHLSQKNLALIFVDQARQKIGAGSFQKQTTFSGGNALRFYASTRVNITLKEKLLNKHKKVIGIKVGFDIEKNKIAPPFRNGTFRILFDYGIDDISSSLDWLQDHGYLGSTTGYVIWLDDKKYRFDELVCHIEENSLEDELTDFVYDSWKEIYAKVDRKRKIR